MSAVAKAKDLMIKLCEDKEIADEFDKLFQTEYIIFGKVPREWNQHFTIHVASDPDPSECKRLVAKVADLYQEASFYYSIAEAQEAALSNGREKKLSAELGRVIAEFKMANPATRLPAADTFKAMALEQASDLVGAAANAQIIKDFWKRILNRLTEIRKCIEHAVMSNGILVKQEMLLSNPEVGKTPTRTVFRGVPDNEEDTWDAPEW